MLALKPMPCNIGEYLKPMQLKPCRGKSLFRAETVEGRNYLMLAKSEANIISACNVASIESISCKYKRVERRNDAENSYSNASVFRLQPNVAAYAVASGALILRLKCFGRHEALIYHDDCKNQREGIQKELVECEAKIESMKSTIKNLQANRGSGNTAEELEKLQAKIREQETTITTLQATQDKDKSMADPAEATSCLAFGNSSDIQTIRVPGAEAFQVSCDSRFAGAGWTVIQRRVDDSVDFNRNWEEYKNGFGDLRGNFWLGLERLHLMTKFRPHELYIQMEDFKNDTRYARYTNFTIGSEAQSYELLGVGEYDGNAGNALDGGDGYSAKNMKFSTPERDNDKYDYFNCASAFASGWWWNDCFWCNPNGVYVNTETDEYNFLSIKWDAWQKEPMKFVHMMIRPNNN
ncbi:maker546 [Drosophila busckii]|uniref:Maker546 n=1 Tax=Drosophila busckii TaxID=30019 RepID=A0A0M4EDG0_DROBS|nr:maker546 [Drosophila busckii]